MKPRLILHIGAHRTATSALQDYLHRNFDALLERGFFYAFNVRRHLKLMNDLFSGARTVDEAAKQIRQRMKARGAHLHTAILSDEDICMRPDISVLAGFRERFDVRVVFTLRRQDTWLESWYFQNIKWQWNKKLSHCTFDEFLHQRGDFHWIHYDAYVRHLESLFGQENIILNVLEKAQMPAGPIEAFCTAIGLDDRDGFADPAHMNARFSPRISEFMRRLPLDEAPPEYRNVLTRACAQIDRKLGPERDKQSERLLDANARARLMDEYDPGNQALATRYFGRPALFLEPLPPRDAPLAEMALPAGSDALIAQYVAPLISELIAHHKKTSETGKGEATGEPAPGARSSRPETAKG